MLKLAIQSLPYFQNYRTFLITFIVEPLFSILMVGLLSSQFSSSFFIHTIVAMSIISGAQTLIATLNTEFVDDQKRGIDLELAVSAPFSIPYWRSKIMAALLVAIGQVLVILTLIRLLTGDGSWLGRAFAITPVVLIFACIVGFVATVAAWRKSDPYFFGNIVGILIVLLSGVIVPLSHYPVWLKILTELLPFSHLMQWLITGKGELLIDCVIALFWLILAALVYRWKLKKVKEETNYL